MHRRSAADAAFGVFVRRQIADVFLIWVRILCLAHFSWFPFGFVARPHSGFGPPCGAREWLLGLSDAALNALGTATFGVFFWLQITHINLRFVFFLFAHIIFLSLLVVFLVLDCVSRAEIFAAAYDLLVWDQVVQTD
jgi:hypothetical protein